MDFIYSISDTLMMWQWKLSQLRSSPYILKGWTTCVHTAIKLFNLDNPENMVHNSNTNNYIKKVSTESGGVWEAILQKHPVIQQLGDHYGDRALSLKTRLVTSFPRQQWHSNYGVGGWSQPCICWLLPLSCHFRNVHNKEKHLAVYS